MNEMQALEKLYEHIKANGTKPTPKPYSLGGIWSEDRYDLNGVSACLQDDGSTRAIRAEGCFASTTYGRPVEYYFQSNAENFKTVYRQFFPEDTLEF